MKLYRTSGLPPHPVLMNRFKEEFREGFDAIESELGKCSESNHEVWNHRLQELETRLEARYPRVEDLSILDQKDLAEKIQTYGSTLAFCFEPQADGGNELVAYLMDS